MTLVAGTTYWGKWGHSWEELADRSGVLGAVSFTDAGKVCLSIPDGSLLALAQDEVGTGVEYADYLYGFLDVGHCVVLQDCHYSDYCHRLNEIETQTITANTLLSYKDAFDPNAQMDEISFRLQHLERWAIPTDENNTGQFSGFIQNDKPAPCIKREWYSGEELSVWVACGPSMKFDQPSSIDMKRDCKITIRFTNAVTLGEATDKAYSLLLLVSFCAGWYAGFTEVIATSSDGAAISIVEQFRKGTFRPDAQHKPPIPYGFFEPRSSDIIKKWLDSKDNFRTAIREYVPIALLDRSAFLELEFFATSQILETLGRAVDEINSGAKKKNADFLAKLKIEAEDLDDGDLKTWVLQKIDEKSRPTLIQLLKNLYSFVGPYSKEIYKDKHGFAYHQAEDRHVFAHGKHSASALENSNLFFRTKGNFMLCQAAIMRLLDISEDDVFELLDKCHSPYVKWKLNN